MNNSFGISAKILWIEFWTHKMITVIFLKDHEQRNLACCIERFSRSKARQFLFLSTRKAKYLDWFLWSLLARFQSRFFTDFEWYCSLLSHLDQEFTKISLNEYLDLYMNLWRPQLLCFCRCDSSCPLAFQSKISFQSFSNPFTLNYNDF
jgi:hypothetical protein